MMQTQRAFTLVELSIVLVILGLLVGGVLTGQSLIRAAELRSVTTQFDRYVTATQTFRDKYFGLPGDLTNAQSYWGVAHATAATCVTTASTTAVTCNGDGNGKVDVSAGSNERFRYWQHLANAGLVEGSYNGIAQGASDYATGPTNSPAGKISSSYWISFNLGVQSAASGWFDGNYENALEFGGFVSNAHPFNPIMKPEEVYNIDTKMDDGKPATGKVVMRGVIASCTDASASSTLSASYLLSNAAMACAIVFRQVF